MTIATRYRVWPSSPLRLLNPSEQHLHGKFATHPFANRRIPIVTDDTVNMEVGSGAIRIAPAHNAYDYEIGRRHNLPFINVLDDDGYVTETAGEMFKVRIRWTETPRICSTVFKRV